MGWLIFPFVVYVVPILMLHLVLQIAICIINGRYFHLAYKLSIISNSFFILTAIFSPDFGDTGDIQYLNSSFRNLNLDDNLHIFFIIASTSSIFSFLFGVLPKENSNLLKTTPLLALLIPLLVINANNINNISSKRATDKIIRQEELKVLDLVEKDKAILKLKGDIENSFLASRTTSANQTMPKEYEVILFGKRTGSSITKHKKDIIVTVKAKTIEDTRELFISCIKYEDDVKIKPLKYPCT